MTMWCSSSLFHWYSLAIKNIRSFGSTPNQFLYDRLIKSCSRICLTPHLKKLNISPMTQHVYNSGAKNNLNSYPKGFIKHYCLFWSLQHVILCYRNLRLNNTTCNFWVLLYFYMIFLNWNRLNWSKSLFFDIIQWESPKCVFLLYGKIYFGLIE